MKKVLLFIVSMLCAAALVSCGRGGPGSKEEYADGREQQEVDITLWVFPVGNWSNPTAVASLLNGFHREYPDINVAVEYLTYENGDEKIEQALAEGTGPDLILEGPERLVANWGDRGVMVDLTDLWDSDAADRIYENIRKACRHSNGEYYIFPICMTAHCMAINYDMFREAGALPYIDEENHSWTTENFIQAVHALTAYGQEKVGTIYCKNQSGDQGTRALVTNLCGGSFTDGEHQSYTIDSPENIRALQLLYDLEGIVFEPEVSSIDSIGAFCRKELAMCFCWNVSIEIQQTVNNPDLDFEVFPMAFPSEDGKAQLQGGIWGFGIFDSGDEARIRAAGALIRFMTENDVQYTQAVRASTYWPVRDMENIYVNDMLMTEYSIFTPRMGDYYQITPGWTEARAAWWKVLQEIGAGRPASEAVRDFPKESR